MHLGAPPLCLPGDTFWNAFETFRTFKSEQGLMFVCSMTCKHGFVGKFLITQVTLPNTIRVILHVSMFGIKMVPNRKTGSPRLFGRTTRHRTDESTSGIFLPPVKSSSHVLTNSETTIFFLQFRRFQLRCRALVSHGFTGAQHP